MMRKGHFEIHEILLHVTLSTSSHLKIPERPNRLSVSSRDDEASRPWSSGLLEDEDFVFARR